MIIHLNLVIKYDKIFNSISIIFPQGFKVIGRSTLLETLKSFSPQHGRENQTYSTVSRNVTRLLPCDDDFYQAFDQ